MARSEAAPAWRRAFLRELARGGSVALAAASVGIDRSSAYQVRRRNAAFAASWERALERARERLVFDLQAHPQPLPQAGGESPAPSVPLPLAGGVRGGRGPRLRPDEIVRGSKAGRAFLAELAASANVRAAARAAGVSTVAAYNRRRLWPAFAAAWREAKAEGYERLELLLIHAATATLEPAAAAAARGGEDAAPTMTVGEAMNLLKLHRAAVQGGRAQRYGWRLQEPDIKAVRAEILRKVAAMEKAGRPDTRELFPDGQTPD